MLATTIHVSVICLLHGSKIIKSSSNSVDGPRNVEVIMDGSINLLDPRHQQSQDYRHH